MYILPEVQAILDEFKSVFPVSAGPPHLITRCQCAECSAVSDALAGKPWDSLDPESIPLGVLLLAPEAFAYFLPAYIKAALLNINDHSSELACALHSHDLSPRFTLLSDVQSRAVLRYLEYEVARHNDLWGRSHQEAIDVYWGRFRRDDSTGY